VTREEIRAQLWPDGTFVDFDSNISSAVRKLRDTLCDSAAEPRYIETVGRVGYRFIAEANFVSDRTAKTEPSPKVAEVARSGNLISSGEVSAGLPQILTEPANVVSTSSRAPEKANGFTRHASFLSVLRAWGLRSLQSISHGIDWQESLRRKEAFWCHSRREMPLQSTRPDVSFGRDVAKTR